MRLEGWPAHQSKMAEAQPIHPLRQPNMSQPGFWKNVITVLAGATGAQALPLLVAPLLTRMCTPAEMGAFSVWLGVIAVTSIVATLRIDTVMVLDLGLGQQRLCFSVVAWAASALALALTLAAVAACIVDLPVVQTMTWLELLTIGAGTWLTAIMQTTLAYAASHRLFGKAAQAKMMQAGTIALAQVSLLYAGLAGTALLAGQLIGLAAGLWAARQLLAPPAPRLGLRLDAAQRSYLIKHQAFWRFSLPSSLLNTLVGQLPLFMIGLRHGALAAGLFALTQRVLSAPVTLVAASVLEVFKRQAVQEFQAHGNCRSVYLATLRGLVLLALVPSLMLFLFSPDLFSWMFGRDWRPAGEFARVLAPLCFFNFVASPLSYVFFIAGKQKMELRWQIALFLMTVAVFSAPLSLCQSVLWYAIGRSLLYLVYLAMSYHCSLNGSNLRLGPARSEASR
jgi:O-antigen/teichoic acid export membrane protein